MIEKFKPPVILNITHHCQNPLHSTWWMVCFSVLIGLPQLWLGSASRNIILQFLFYFRVHICFFCSLTNYVNVIRHDTFPPNDLRRNRNKEDATSRLDPSDVWWDRVRRGSKARHSVGVSGQPKAPAALKTRSPEREVKILYGATARLDFMGGGRFTLSWNRNPIPHFIMNHFITMGARLRVVNL
jgi:hypothetical protein